MESKKSDAWVPFDGAGLIIAMLSALFFSAQALLVAEVKEVHALEVTFFRMAIQALLIIPVVLCNKESFCGDPDDYLMLWLRAMLGTCSMCLMYYAIHHMPLGDASVLHFSSPVFVGIMACCLLKETCGVFEIITTIVTLAGVVFIAQPPFMFHSSSKHAKDGTPDKPFSYERLIASGCALLASICGAGVHITLRKLKHVHYSTVVFTYSVWGMIQSAIVSYIINIWTLPTPPNHWGFIFGVGVFAVLAQICFTVALKTENAGSVSILRSTEIVFAFIWQIIFLKEYPNVFSIIGTVLVMACAVSYGVRKWYNIRALSKHNDADEKGLVHGDSQDEKSSLAKNLKEWMKRKNVR